MDEDKEDRKSNFTAIIAVIIIIGCLILLYNFCKSNQFLCLTQALFGNQRGIRVYNINSAFGIVD